MNFLYKMRENVQYENRTTDDVVKPKHYNGFGKTALTINICILVGSADYERVCCARRSSHKAVV